MFRAVFPRRQFNRLSSAYHTTSVLRTTPKKKYVPADWYIVDAGPGGGLELAMLNKKTPEATWYTPEGMTAEEILAIPGAKKYWRTIDEVKEYMEERAVAKRTDGPVKDLMEQLAEHREAAKERKV